MGHHILAFISATDGVEVRGLEAIRTGHDVVRRDDLASFRVGFVKRAQRTEVVDLLCEGPMGMEGHFVEGRERNTTWILGLHAP